MISTDKYLPGNFVSMDQYMVREPGQFPMDYNHAREANMFHGGTILCNAASKVIHVENQVSIGTD